MATSEIEKLERRYTENPHGLTFAPLAEVHRKNGDVARALELLTAGLELHPNYIPASIVLGRCHQDLGDLVAAEAAFAHVLKLDDENVIALKSLADISERLERYTDAEGWLRRLVSVDRSNEEAREQLQRVEVARQSQPAPAEVAPPLEMIDVSSDEEHGSDQHAEPLPLDVAGMDVNPAPLAASGTQLPEDIDRSEPAVLDIIAVDAPDEPSEPAPSMGDITTASAYSAPAEDHSEQLEPPVSSQAEASPQPLPGLISAEFQPPLESTGGLGVETSEEVVLDASGNSEFRVPDASEDLKSVAARLSGTGDTKPSEPEFSPSPVPAERPEPAEPEFLLTESMAEVLMQQGHSDEALRVYRELVRRHGPDAAIDARIRELEAQVSRPLEQRSYLARDTKGQTVGAFFQSLLSARPALGEGSAGTASDPEGAVPRSAGQNGAVSYADENLLFPPAVPSAEPADEQPADEQPAEAPVTFDSFFGAEPDESTTNEHDQSDSGKDDLDQFQTWLQNLKR